MVTIIISFFVHLLARLRCWKHNSHTNTNSTRLTSAFGNGWRRQHCNKRSNVFYFSFSFLCSVFFFKTLIILFTTRCHVCVCVCVRGFIAMLIAFNDLPLRATFSADGSRFFFLSKNKQNKLLGKSIYRTVRDNYG